MSFYTESGLNTLASLVRDRRGNRSLRQFAELVGVSHKTIDRLESRHYNTPTNLVLARIAPHLGYTLEELLGILTSQQTTTSERLGETSSENEDLQADATTTTPFNSFCSAADLVPLIDNLPPCEIEKLLEYIKDLHQKINISKD